ncbi:hypothetical protein [Gemmobacter serpentinus]|uniref:hypothetical protein n=1 Tax=Gemmobacter serpentinus TaxID=2652247 RepID=UPI00124CF4D1|nr:hypothetical protein [Gemmobacter serpentinus]
MTQAARHQASKAAATPGPAVPEAAPPARRPDVLIEPLRDDARLRVWRHRGTSQRLVVCFSGVGRLATQPPRLEFAKTASGSGRDHVLFIADPARSWLNAPGLIEEIAGLVETEAARIGAAQVVAMGHSLGGFSALVLGGFTKVDVALAMSPQYSVAPDLVPDEPRWMGFRNKITEWRIRQAGDHMNAATDHVVIFGRAGREAPQRRLMRPAANVACYLLPRVRHDSVVRLHEAGVLDEVVQLAFDGRKRRLRQLLAERMKASQVSVDAAQAGEDAA